MTVRRCALCGRQLTDPASVRTGLGPTCRARLAPAPPMVAGPDPRPAPGPGQTALTLTPLTPPRPGLAPPPTAAALADRRITDIPTGELL